MKIDFTGRGVEITDAIRVFTESKLQRLAKHHGEIHDAGVVLSVEKYRQRAEIKFMTQKKSFHGAEETNDMRQSIDRVVDKLEAQLKRHKDKASHKKRHKAQSIRMISAEQVEQDLQTESPADGEIQVIRNNHSFVKPMNLEEAVEELVKFNHEFLIFQNPDSQQLNVVYQRKDGNVGLVEPRT